MIELTVLGAGPAYTSRPGAVGASYLLRSGATAIVARPGAGGIHQPGRDDRAELAAGGRGQPSPPGSFHRPRPAAALPAVGLQPAAPGRRPRACRTRPTGSMRSTTRSGSRRRRSTSADLGGSGSRAVGPFNVEARLVAPYRRELWVPRHGRRRIGPGLLGRLWRRRRPARAHPPRRHSAGRSVVRDRRGGGRLGAPQRGGRRPGCCGRRSGPDPPDPRADELRPGRDGGGRPGAGRGRRQRGRSGRPLLDLIRRPATIGSCRPPASPPSADTCAWPSNGRGRPRSHRARCPPSSRPPRHRSSRSSGRRTRITATAATNLAMKLARPYRRAPLEIARVLADELAREADADAGDHARSARSTWPPPDSSTSAYADRALAGAIDGILASPADWGRVPAERPRRVNVEFVSANPTGSADDRQRPRGVRRRPALPGPRGRRPAGHPRVLLQRLGQPGPQPRAPRSSRIRRGEPVPEDGYHGDYVGELAAARAGRRLGRRRAAPGPTPAASSGAGRRSGSGPGSRRSLEHLGVHFDVWTTEALAPRRRLGRAGDRAAPRRRPRLRAGRRAVVPLDGVRRRQGPGDHPLRTASRPTSPPTSATSPRSSAAASTS